MPWMGNSRLRRRQRRSDLTPRRGIKRRHGKNGIMRLEEDDMDNKFMKDMYNTENNIYHQIELREQHRKEKKDAKPKQGDGD